MKFVRRNVAAAAVAVFASFATHPVFAQDQVGDGTDTSNRVYGGIMGSYLNTAANLRAVHYGTGALLYYGHEFGYSNWFVEGSAFSQDDETKRADLTDFYRRGGGLDLVYALNQRKGTSFFILAGGGGEYYDVVPNQYDKYAGYVDAGGGVITGPIIYDLRIRAEARFVHDFYGDGKNDYQFSVGFELPLFKPERTHYVPPPPTAEPVAVTPTVITETTTIRETMVDTDGDGVPDQFDKCPGTPLGMKVDGVGCGMAQVITLTGVTFDFNKATLTPESRKILEDVAQKVKNFNVKMELEGHTDGKGSDAYNDKLSKERAESVRKFLIEQGVKGSLLTAKGYGKRVPIADNATEAGRSLNRRVELHVEGESASSMTVTVPVEAGQTPTSAPLPGPVVQTTTTSTITEGSTTTSTGPTVEEMQAAPTP